MAHGCQDALIFVQSRTILPQCAFQFLKAVAQDQFVGARIDRKAMIEVADAERSTLKSQAELSGF